ncbi:MAG: hypothetical protein CMF12_00970 [Idiomarina sp.]|nr:hypothetical protein [Idiomarina sp.]
MVVTWLKPGGAEIAEDSIIIHPEGVATAILVHFAAGADVDIEAVIFQRAIIFVVADDAIETHNFFVCL